MRNDFTGISIVAGTAQRYAAELFAEELGSRTGTAPAVTTEEASPCVVFKTAADLCGKDAYRITETARGLLLEATGIRGWIFAYSLFLRKTEYRDGRILLVRDITGTYKPDKAVRGHQLGYRTTPNAYDAWDCAQYFRYYRDLMFFGCNTVEHIPYESGFSRRNALMRYDEEEFLVEASAMADRLDMDVSLWYPNAEEDLETALQNREKVFKSMPRLDVVFPPGGDPGELEPDELFTRCEAFRTLLRQYHPNAALWPSAQQPHGMPLWGEAFLQETGKEPKRIDGVVTGPNRAFTLDELRRRLPAAYPIRLYPDITHNVRCEYPVHFDRDDWHYALTTTLSRECVNPRPTEYREIHRLTRRYIVGSVSYSEGINDDVNKCVWSDMDFFPDVPLRETLEDYARLFFVGSDAAAVADAILALEKNWEGSPDENPFIETTLAMWEHIGQKNPALLTCWRYNKLLFRACCDALVRRRLLFETGLIDRARVLLLQGDIEEADTVLATPFDDAYNALREKLETLAQALFTQIGYQLDVRRYGANSWERGATLETIDLPITDRLWLQKKTAYAKTLPARERQAYLRRILTRNLVASDEYYFSFALHGFTPLGVRQEPDFYMNFQGDRPNVNDGTLPVCMFKLYDHFSFRCKLGGFAPDTEYVLQMTFKDNPNPLARRFRVAANGKTVYEGKAFGGVRNEAFERELLPAGYAAVCYRLSPDCFQNGCIELSVSEPILGFLCSEFRIVKYDENFQEFC